MAGKAESSKIAGISDAAVEAATGKNWSQWCTLLDKAGAAAMPHKDIANYLHARHAVPGWWCQMVTVGYEQARGLRQKHQKPDGYSVSASRTIAVPLPAVFAAWKDKRSRDRWLSHVEMEVRRSTPNKSMRISGPDGTRIDVNFYAKGAAKSQVTVQHEKLPDARTAVRLKTHWGKQLDALRALLEKSSSAGEKGKRRKVK